MTSKYKVSIFLFIIISIIESSIIVYAKDTVSENNLDTLVYSKVLELISELENAADEYINSDNENYNTSSYDKDMLVLTYIRGIRYNSSSWNTLAGSRDIEFDNFIKLNYPDVVSLRNIDNLVVPTGDEIDFIHMVASINMYSNGYGVLGSWGGDLSSIIIDLCSEEDDYDKLYIKASSLINSINSKFNIYDMNSDLDANNIYLIMKENSMSLSEAMMMYYNDVDSNSDRVRKFVDSKYMLEDFTNGNLRNCYLTEFTNDIFSDVYLSTKGVDMHERPTLIEACSDAFVDYLYSSYPDISIESIKFTDSSDRYLYLGSDFILLGYEITPRFNIKKKVISFKYNSSMLSLVNNSIKPINEGVSSITICDEVSHVYDSLVIHVMNDSVNDCVSDNSMDDSSVTYKDFNKDAKVNKELQQVISYIRLNTLEKVSDDYTNVFQSQEGKDVSNITNISESISNFSLNNYDEDNIVSENNIVSEDKNKYIDNDNYLSRESYSDNKNISFIVKVFIVVLIVLILICMILFIL